MCVVMFVRLSVFWSSQVHHMLEYVMAEILEYINLLEHPYLHSSDPGVVFKHYLSSHFAYINI